MVLHPTYIDLARQNIYYYFKFFQGWLGMILLGDTFVWLHSNCPVCSLGVPLILLLLISFTQHYNDWPVCWIQSVLPLTFTYQILLYIVCISFVVVELIVCYMTSQSSYILVLSGLVLNICSSSCTLLCLIVFFPLALRLLLVLVKFSFICVSW